jgi:hypothetical protein
MCTTTQNNALFPFCEGVVALWGLCWLCSGCVSLARECSGLIGNKVAQQGIWWLSRGCGGSIKDLVAQSGHVVAHLVKAYTEGPSVPGSNPASLTVSWMGPRNMTVFHKPNLRVGGTPPWVKNNFKKNPSVLIMTLANYILKIYI